MFFDYKNKNNIIAFFSTFILGIITHFTIFITESIAPDALVTGSYKISGAWEMSLGRWGIRFLDTIRGGIVSEVVIIVLSLIFLSFMSVAIYKILNIENKFAIILISFIIATAPQFSETFMFIYCADSYCLSALLATLFAYCITKKAEKKHLLIIGIIFGIISLSIYQAYIALTIVLIIIKYVLDLIKNSLNDKKIIMEFVKDMLIIGVSMICYFVITKAILFINGLEFASYKGASSMSIKNIILNLPKTIINSYIIIWQYLFKEDILYNNFWHRNILNSLLFIMFFAYLIKVIIENKIYINKAKIICIFICFIIFPLGINVISIIMPDTVTNIVTGPALLMMYILVIAFIENSNLKNNIQNKIVRNTVNIILAFMIFTYIMSDNATYMARDEVYKNYYNIANNILTKAYSIDGYSAEKKWIFTDNIRYVSKFANMSTGVIANDYETWDNIDGIWANYQFFSRYLGVELNMATKEEYYKMIEKEEIKNMKEYPSKDCVKVIGDYIVVKISNSHY